MDVRKTIAGIVVVVLALILGTSPDSLSSIADLIDPPEAGRARVEEVVDGDTIIVRFGNTREKVRLIGVDTPETNHPDKAVQCYGNAATNYVTGLVDGQDVRLEMDPTNTNRDRYDRLLRYVYDEDGRLVNQLIIEEGYGFAYTIFPFQKMTEFEAAEDSAQSDNRGLWNECEIIESGDTLNTAPAESGG